MNPASGGPCQGIRNSIPELKKLGVHNEVVCLDDPTAAYLKEDKFTIHALASGKGPWCYSSRLMPWLLQNIQRFDIIIVHGLWLYPSYALTKAIKLLKNKPKLKGKQVFHIPKVFIMPHGMLDPYFQEDSGRRLKAIRNWCYWKVIENKVINNADGLLFTCETELILARKPFRPYNPKKEINVGYGIKKPPLYNSKMKDAFLKLCPTLNGDSYILFLSRIHEKKGVDLLLKAFSMQLNKKPNRTGLLSKLIIAGPGIDSPYGLKMREIVNNDPALKENVIFTGLLLGDAKWGAYYGCEAFILPSHQENFGIAVAEALACSRPVLISDKVNIWQEIEDAGAGIVKTNSLEGVTGLIEAWQQMPATEKTSMQLNAKGLFEKSYTSAAATLELYRAITE